MNLNKLATQVYQNNKAKGFWDERETIPQKMKECGQFTEQEIEAVIKAFQGQAIALMHSELSEALEANRKDLMDDKLPHRKGDEVELADAFIRILDYMGGYKMDLDGSTTEKLAYNTSRPYKHGKKY